MDKKPYLFCYDYGTGGIWYYFRAHEPNDVRRKYPILTYVEDEPTWLNSKEKERMLAETFDVDVPPSSSPRLEILKRAADEYFASLGERVLPPR